MNKQVLRWNFVFQYGYVITNIINSVILLPFYLHKIDASTLGVWLATGNILAWMTLVDPGVGEVLQQKIAELRGKNNTSEIGKTIGSGLISSGGILLLAVVTGFACYFLIGAIINKDVTRYPNLQVALFISIISTGMSLVSFSISGINQGMHNASHVAISSILANILFLVVNIVLLCMGFGVISIAFANLCRGLFINAYNFWAMKALLVKEKIQMVFEFAHFKKFVRIFSFTSLASIIGGFSASMDTIVLARFIAPWMITIFEINKRPVQLSQSLIGRHSVALMPVVSHAAGEGDKKGIMELINAQFKYYSYAAIFVALIFCFEYRDLIAAWTGPGKFAGNNILYLLVANFFFALIGYFMANIGYAVGDIKMNSLVNIAKGVGVGILYYAVGKTYGIPGVLTVMLAGNVIVEFGYFSYRLFKLGYLQSAFIKKTSLSWLVCIPVVSGITWLLVYGADRLLTANMYLIRLVLNGGIFTLTFAAVVLLTDRDLRQNIFDSLKQLPKFKLNTGKRNLENKPLPVVAISNDLVNNNLNIQQ